MLFSDDKILFDEFRLISMVLELLSVVLEFIAVLFEFAFEFSSPDAGMQNNKQIKIEKTDAK